MKKTDNNGILFLFRGCTNGLKRYFFLAALCSFGSILFNFLSPQIIRITVDSVLGDKEFAFRAAEYAVNLLGGRNALRSNLYLCAVAVFACALAEGLFTLVSRLSLSHCTESCLKRLRDRIFGHIQRLPFSWHTFNSTGDTIQRCTADMDVIRNFIANQLLEVIRITILIATALFLMAGMNLPLTLCAALFIPIVAGYSGIFFAQISKRFRIADESEGELMSFVQENLTGVRVVRAFGRERFELDRFDEKNNKLYHKWVDLGYLLGAYWGIGDMVTGLQVLTIICVGCYYACSGGITLGEFLVFVSYNRTLAYPLRRLGRILSDMSKMKVSCSRLCEILSAEEEGDGENVLSADGIKGDIEFKHVTFSYRSVPVLKDVSFHVPRGTTLGVLGATGSGKSTLCSLIDRLYDADEGLIMIDGHDIREYDRRSLRSKIGLVLQEPFLFSKTIAENIAIAKPDSSMEDIRAAARISDIDESITGFANGYETAVGERGVTLSGGQKQRIAIARTLICSCPVLIFDDSLSAVDLGTDARIRASLKKSAKGSTVILISHRINTLMDSDNIIVLENGRIAEMGTHESLIAQNGIYRRTYDLQRAAADTQEDI